MRSLRFQAVFHWLLLTVMAIFIGSAVQAQSSVQYPDPDEVFQEARMFQDSMQKVYDHLVSKYQDGKGRRGFILLDTTRFFVLRGGLESIKSRKPFTGSYMLIDTTHKREIIGYFPTNDFAKGFHLEARSGVLYKGSLYEKVHHVVDVYFQPDGTIKSSAYGSTSHFIPSEKIYTGEYIPMHVLETYPISHWEAGIERLPKATYSYQNGIFKGLDCYPKFTRGEAGLFIRFDENKNVDGLYYSGNGGSHTLTYHSCEEGKEIKCYHLIGLRQGISGTVEVVEGNEVEITHPGKWWLPISNLVKVTEEGIFVRQLK